METMTDPRVQRQLDVWKRYKLENGRGKSDATLSSAALSFVVAVQPANTVSRTARVASYCGPGAIRWNAGPV